MQESYWGQSRNNRERTWEESGVCLMLCYGRVDRCEGFEKALDMPVFFGLEV